MKERLVVGVITLSLDGNVTGPAGDMSWSTAHTQTEAARAQRLQVARTATTALLGRTNYLRFAGFWPMIGDDEDAHQADRAYSRWFISVEKIVFSATGGDGAARFTSADPVTTVKALRKEVGGDIAVLASAGVIRALLDAGELDRLAITLCPELVGGEARLFQDGPAGSSWELATATPTGTGAICLLYERIR
jgi:dihydrofolate reductase